MYEGIVVIAGVPRSGTSWLGQIVDSSPEVAYRFQPFFSYAFKDAVQIDSLRHEYEEFFKGLYQSDDVFLLQTDKRQDGQYPVFRENPSPSCLAFKTCRYQYLIPKMLGLFPNLVLIGIVRHPCGAINSWLKNPSEFPATADQLAEWRFGACKNLGRSEEFFGFYKWKEVAHLYLDLQQKYPDRVLVVHYDKLVENTWPVVNRIFSFAGLQISEQTRSFIAQCQSTHVETSYSVFRNRSVKDKWRTELAHSIRDEILFDLKGTRLEVFLD